MKKLHEKKISELELGYETWGDGIDWELYRHPNEKDGLLLRFNDLRQWAIAVVRELRKSKEFKAKHYDGKELTISYEHTKCVPADMNQGIAPLIWFLIDRFELTEEEWI